MNPISSQAFASVFSFVGTIIGVPSLTVLLLYAINEIRDRINPAPAISDLGGNADALTTALNLLIAILGHHLIITATSGLILAGLCWIIGRGFQLRTSPNAVSHLRSSVSICG